jgi:Icc-related predicted phosphoesterase
MMYVLAISDLHGFLPEIPECDLLLLGGDYCKTRNIEQERRFMKGEFTDWLKGIKARYIVGIAGNHDFILQHDQELAKSLPWIYLQDEVLNLEGVGIYGTPWTPMFWDWAFMKREPELKQVFNGIPYNLDILLSHGPGYRHLDRTNEGVHAGSFELWNKVKAVKPDSHVFGHIHEARGVMEEAPTRFYNVSHVNLQYAPKHGPVHIPLRIE